MIFLRARLEFHQPLNTLYILPTALAGPNLLLQDHDPENVMGELILDRQGDIFQVDSMGEGFSGRSNQRVQAGEN